MRKFLYYSFRIVVSVGLLAYLIHLADFNKIIAAFEHLSVFPLLLAMGAFLVTVVVLTLRWQLLTNAYGLVASYARLFVFYFIGFFFNNFLPTSIGGDLARAYYLGQTSRDKAASLGTVFLERVIGLLATLFLATISLFWLMGTFNSNRIIYFTTFLGFLIAFFLAMVMSRRLYRRFHKLISKVTFYRIGERITRVLDTLHFYRDKKVILISTFLISIGAQLVLILMNYILSTALGIEQVSLGHFFLIVPITFMFSLLPSINGIGVRDSGYILLLGKYGVDPAHAISLSFLVMALPMLVSLVGGFFFLFYRHKGIEIPSLTEEEFT
ncbi:MAG: lysylphosphatidylglycerol synthase transmembrane domain-containing protein [Calditrichia bacterium]